jgi:quinoprotein glucose dehydrogenase
MEMLRHNDDQDAYLRHAGVMALTWISDGDPQAVLPAAHDENVGVRMAVLLTLRRMASPEVARFLADPEPRLVLEAARAINDLPIRDALPALAMRLDQPATEALQRRVINANYRLGGADQAQALAAFSIRESGPESIRAEAVRQLGLWRHPSGRDAITGLWRPVADRTGDAAIAALQSVLKQLLVNPASIQMAAALAVRQLNLTDAGPDLYNLYEQNTTSPAVRAVLLETLADLKDPTLAKAIELGQDSQDINLRNTANRLQARANPRDALPRLETALSKGSIPEQQAALATLAAIPDPQVDVLLNQWMKRLLDNKVPAPLKLDLLEAANQRNTPEIQDQIAAYESRRKAEDPLRSHRECLEGGNADLGRKIFQERMDVYCARCHIINGQGGVAGPDLSTIGSSKDRLYIMESILYPNAKIAEGFETIVLTLQGDTTYAGLLTTETEATLEINSLEDGLVTVNKAHIESIESGPSGMPEEIRQVLTKREVRDLVEFLSGLK